MESARKHGRLRYEQGYTIPQIVLEARLLQNVISSIVQEELLCIDLSTLVPDTFLIGEGVQAALEISIRSFKALTPKSLQTSFASLYKSPHLGVAIVDEERVIDANDAFLGVIQHTREQLDSGEIDSFEMTPEEFRPLHMNALDQLREFGACVPFEKEYLLPDGSRQPLLVGAVRLSSEPLQWSMYVVDLTEQRKLHAAERKLREWESRHLLINQLAHEINNPLAALNSRCICLGLMPISRSAFAILSEMPKPCCAALESR